LILIGIGIAVGLALAALFVWFAFFRFPW